MGERHKHHGDFILTESSTANIMAFTPRIIFKDDPLHRGVPGHRSVQTALSREQRKAKVNVAPSHTPPFLGRFLGAEPYGSGASAWA